MNKGFDKFSKEWLTTTRPKEAEQVWGKKKEKERSCAVGKENIIHEYKIKIKPLSVNDAWKGKRVKTEMYKNYELAVGLMLPNFILPASPLKIYYEFGFSSSGSDLDNPCKQFTDILSKKYHFNDNEIFEMNIKKVIVKKGQEYLLFKIESL